MTQKGLSRVSNVLIQGSLPSALLSAAGRNLVTVPQFLGSCCTLLKPSTEHRRGSVTAAIVTIRLAPQSSDAFLSNIGTIPAPATGSAHHHPAMAFRSNPPKRIAEKYVQKSVCRESACMAPRHGFANHEESRSRQIRKLLILRFPRSQQSQVAIPFVRHSYSQWSLPDATLADQHARIFRIVSNGFAHRHPTCGPWVTDFAIVHL